MRKKVFKAGTTVAAVTTALTIYNNVDKIKAILEKKDKENRLWHYQTLPFQNITACLEMP